MNYDVQYKRPKQPPKMPKPSEPICRKRPACFVLMFRIYPDHHGQTVSQTESSQESESMIVLPSNMMARSTVCIKRES